MNFDQFINLECRTRPLLLEAWDKLERGELA